MRRILRPLTSIFWTAFCASRVFDSVTVSTPLLKRLDLVRVDRLGDAQRVLEGTKRQSRRCILSTYGHHRIFQIGYSPLYKRSGRASKHNRYGLREIRDRATPDPFEHSQMHPP